VFIEKARQLEFVRAIGGIVIDYNTSLKSPNGGVFSMTGDGFNNVQIPLVLMFKEEAFHLLHLLSKHPNLIVYIGDEKYFKETFYQQMEFLESLIEPFNQTSKKWIYGRERRKFCPIVPKKLKQFESILHEDDAQQHTISQSMIQIEHVIEADGNKSVEEITSELFASLNLTAINFGGQLSNIEAYRSALDKMVRKALTSTNQTQEIQLPVEIRTTVKEETSTTTTDTREYTEKRLETKKKN
jgi:hypothetical protein